MDTRVEEKNMSSGGMCLEYTEPHGNNGWHVNETPGVGRMVVVVDTNMHIGRGYADIDDSGVFIVEKLSGYFTRRLPLDRVAGWMYVEEFKWPV